MALPKIYRYNDLKARAVVRSRVQLKNLVEKQGFPRGRMLSPNSRGWYEFEIIEWLESRPAANPDPEKYHALGQAAAEARKLKRDTA